MWSMGQISSRPRVSEDMMGVLPGSGVWGCTMALCGLVLGLVGTLRSSGQGAKPYQGKTMQDILFLVTVLAEVQTGLWGIVQCWGPLRQQIPWPDDGSKPNRYHNPVESLPGQRVFCPSWKTLRSSKAGRSKDGTQLHSATIVPPPALTLLF